jgi:hypothetical protein
MLEPSKFTGEVEWEIVNVRSDFLKFPNEK